MRRSSRRHSSVAAGFRVARLPDPEIADWRRSVIDAYTYLDTLYFPSSGRLHVPGRISRTVPSKSRRKLARASFLSLSFSCALRVCTLSVSNGRASVTESVHFIMSRPREMDGAVSLLTHGPKRHVSDTVVKATVHFTQFMIEGEAVRHAKKRTLGPVMWTQFAPPQKQVIRLQAQLADLPAPQTPRLAFRSRRRARNGRYKWTVVARAQMNKDSKTALFVLRVPPKWRSARRVRYRVVHSFAGRDYRWHGVIPLSITASRKPKIAQFSCDRGYLFPQQHLVEDVRRKKPDLLAFMGDQIYENGGIMGTFGVAWYPNLPFRMTIQDFMYKYMTFAWMFRHLMARIPSVFLLDDHDYFQSNLWGAAGKRIAWNPATQRESFFTWFQGGFLMPPRWIAAVENVYTGHLPPSPGLQIKTLSQLPVKPYFTTFTLGPLDVFVAEDRKYKSSPMSPGSNPQLLGVHQQRVLDEWADDWTSYPDTRMKVVLSQTVFCSAATHRGFKLRRDNLYTDSGGWPQARRVQAVRAMERARAFSMHGDQHLGSLLRNYGNNEWNGMGQVAFMVPGIANGFPRAWWPGVKKASTRALAGRNFTGKFRDDAGNAIEVVAVANPSVDKRYSQKHRGNWRRMAYDKSSGWGLSVFDAERRSVNVRLYRVGGNIDGEMFNGFPVNVFVGGRSDVLEKEKEMERGNGTVSVKEENEVDAMSL